VRWAPLLALLLLALPARAGAAPEEEPAPTARLVHRGGEPDPGGKVLLQLEVRWPGRPERHLPGRPTLKLPRGATHRLGQTASDFRGDHTRWRTDVVVELPERGGPWRIGPATVPLEAGRLAGTVLKAEPLEVGEPSLFRQLLSQGVGNGAVVLAVLLWLGWRWRSLAPAAPDEGSTLVEDLLERAGAQAPDACLATLVEARLALTTLDVDDSVPPTADALRERLEAVRFGGESVDEDECRRLLTALRAALEEAR